MKNAYRDREHHAAPKAVGGPAAAGMNTASDSKYDVDGELEREWAGADVGRDSGSEVAITSSPCSP